MNSAIKTIEVRKLCKQLHRTAQSVFKGDIRTQIAARDKIRSEFYKHKYVSNEQTIGELIKYGYECNDVLKCQVIQAVSVPGKENVYRASVTQGSLVDNEPFSNDITEAEYKASIRAARKRNKGKTACQEKYIEDSPNI